MNEFEPVCLWPVAAELGEGPIWHAGKNSVYFVDIRGRKVHRCAADGTQRRTWTAPGRPGFIVPVAEGGFIVGLDDGLYQFSDSTGMFTSLRKVEADLPDNRFNDGFVDAQGCLWFGSMDAGETNATGALYRINGRGQVSCADSGYIITNGPATSPDGKTLYHTDTLEKVVYAFDVLEGGELANKRIFVKMEGRGHPDGMAVDVLGDVWIGLFGGGRIDRYSAAGVLTGSVRFPCSNITKLAFGGDDLRTVYVTTAWKGLTPEQRENEPLAGAMFTFRSSTPGLPQNEFSIQDFT